MYKLSRTSQRWRLIGAAIMPIGTFVYVIGKDDQTNNTTKTDTPKATPEQFRAAVCKQFGFTPTSKAAMREALLRLRPGSAKQYWWEDAAELDTKIERLYNLPGLVGVNVNRAGHVTFMFAAFAIHNNTPDFVNKTAVNFVVLEPETYWAQPIVLTHEYLREKTRVTVGTYGGASLEDALDVLEVIVERIRDYPWLDTSCKWAHGVKALGVMTLTRQTERILREADIS